MAGPHHALVLELVRTHPEVLRALLRQRAVHVDVRARVDSLDASAPQLHPVEFTADLVMRFRHGRRRWICIVEVQRGVDPDKPFSWPVYVAQLRARLRQDVVLVIIATNEATARWARRPIADDTLTLQPLVFGPDDIAVLDEAQAVEHPWLAMLAALVHLEHPDRVEIAARAVLAIQRVDPSVAGLYLDVLVAELGADDGDALLERIMRGLDKPYYSKFGKEHYERGQAAGEAQGEVRGEARGQARAVLEVLAARGLEVDETQRQRVMACDDPQRLTRWLTRAATASSLDEVFGDDA